MSLNRKLLAVVTACAVGLGGMPAVSALTVDGHHNFQLECKTPNISDLPNFSVEWGQINARIGALHSQIGRFNAGGSVTVPDLVGTALNLRDEVKAFIKKFGCEGNVDGMFVQIIEHELLPKVPETNVQGRIAIRNALIRLGVDARVAANKTPYKGEDTNGNGNGGADTDDDKNGSSKGSASGSSAGGGLMVALPVLAVLGFVGWAVMNQQAGKPLFPMPMPH